MRIVKSLKWRRIDSRQSGDARALAAVAASIGRRSSIADGEASGKQLHAHKSPPSQDCAFADRARLRFDVDAGGVSPRRRCRRHHRERQTEARRRRFTTGSTTRPPQAKRSRLPSSPLSPPPPPTLPSPPPPPPTRTAKSAAIRSES